MDESIRYLKALVLIQLHTGRDELAIKPEILLARAGIANKEIAEMLGKKVDAVTKTIQRGR